ncbi:hypothetical protein TNCV_499321 [Trichonephila clavipes]|nr:hypothetical protein TNCV_499321 [Trichonephila clavipes]
MRSEDFLRPGAPNAKVDPICNQGRLKTSGVAWAFTAWGQPEILNAGRLTKRQRETDEFREKNLKTWESSDGRIWHGIDQDGVSEMRQPWPVAGYSA